MRDGRNKSPKKRTKNRFKILRWERGCGVPPRPRASKSDRSHERGVGMQEVKNSTTIKSQISEPNKSKSSAKEHKRQAVMAPTPAKSQSGAHKKRSRRFFTREHDFSRKSRNQKRYSYRSTALDKNDRLGCLAEKQSRLCAA